MRILFLTQVLPYPLTGGQKIRAYYLLRHLSKNNSVTLVSFTRQDDLPEYIDHLKKYCEKVFVVPISRSRVRDASAVLESYLTGKPIVIARDRVSKMKAMIREIIQAGGFDLVHADQTSMAMYGLYAHEVHDKSHKPQTVLDQHNALHLVVRRQARYMSGLNSIVWKRESSLLEAYEAELCNKYKHILTVTQNDKDALKALFDPDTVEEIDRRISVVPICMDPSAVQMTEHLPINPNILFVGSLVWPPNTDGVSWFANEILPLLVARIPDACFTVIGKDPPPAIRALAVSESPLRASISIPGFVLDLDPYIAQSRVFAVPLRAGGGMRVKIVDAWLKGIPVVSTSIGAEGLEFRDGDNILVADKPEEFAAAVEKVLCDDHLAEMLRENGRETVEKYYNYHQIYRQVDSIYDELLAN